MTDHLRAAERAIEESHAALQRGADPTVVSTAYALAETHALIAIAQELRIGNELRATQEAPKKRLDRPAHVPDDCCGKCTDSGAWEQWCTQPMGHAGPCKLA